VGLEVEEVRTLEGLAALEPEWRALWDRSAEAGPFQSPAWLTPWTERFGVDGLWALALRRDGVLEGLVPLFVYADPKSGRRQATLLGNGLSDRLDALLAPGLGPELVFDHLRRRQDLWDACDFRDLPQGSPLLAAPAPPGCIEAVEAEAPSPDLALPDTIEALAAGLPKRLRGNLATARNRAEREGAVRVTSASADTLERDFDTLLSLHVLRWGEAGDAGLADPRVRAFHRAATRALLAERWLRLYVLEVGGRPAAAHYGFHVRGRAYFYIGGFDPEMGGFSPGALLLRHAVEQAVREGCASFEFLRGREAYKYAWGAVDRPQFRRRLTRR
jgi:CelD/BcsL family acetyltransferase involved in cellulose biosynthesis